MDSSGDQCNWQNVKLEYFPLNGRAGIVRAMLYYGNIQFVDEKHTFQDWGTLKKNGNYEFEQLPAFECCGRRMFQSGAIITYVARQLNLMGKNSEEEYQIMSLLYNLEDIYPKLLPAIMANTEDAIKQQPAKITEFLTVHGPFFLNIFETRFNNLHGKYFLGDTFSLADVLLTVVLHCIFKSELRRDTWEQVLNQYAPNLSKHIQEVTNNELASFFSNGYIPNVAL